MRWGKTILDAAVLVILAVLACGCASNKTRSTAKATLDQPQAVQARYYEAGRSGSLVFDPPVTVGQPALNLSRELRNPDAFVAFESGSTTFFYLRTDDRFTDDWNDRYERRAISTKVGVSYR